MNFSKMELLNTGFSNVLAVGVPRIVPSSRYISLPLQFVLCHGASTSLWARKGNDSAPLSYLIFHLAWSHSWRTHTRTHWRGASFHLKIVHRHTMYKQRSLSELFSERPTARLLPSSCLNRLTRAIISAHIEQIATKKDGALKPPAIYIVNVVEEWAGGYEFASALFQECQHKCEKACAWSKKFIIRWKLFCAPWPFGSTAAQAETIAVGTAAPLPKALMAELVTYVVCRRCWHWDLMLEKSKLSRGGGWGKGWMLNVANCF